MAPRKDTKGHSQSVRCIDKYRARARRRLMGADAAVSEFVVKEHVSDVTP
jgi:hypothetical protein